MGFAGGSRPICIRSFLTCEAGPTDVEALITMNYQTALAAVLFALFQPACTTMETTAPRLAGTVWTGPSADGGTMHCEFKSGGRMSLSAAPATWRQDGAAVTMEVDNGFATYTGTIDGSTMSGTAHNAAGNQWQWSITRQ